MNTYEHRIGGKEVHMKNFREKTSLWDDLTDEQSEKLVGGVGAGEEAGAGTAGWSGNDNDAGLRLAGFTAPPVTENDDSAVRVVVPGPRVA